MLPAARATTKHKNNYTRQFFLESLHSHWTKTVQKKTGVNSAHVLCFCSISFVTREMTVTHVWILSSFTSTVCAQDQLILNHSSQFVQVHSHKHVTEGPEVAGQFRPTKHLALFQFHRLFQQHYKLSININIKFMYTMSFEDFLFIFSAHYRQIITHDNKSFFFSCWTQVCLSVTSESVCLTVCT